MRRYKESIRYIGNELLVLFKFKREGIKIQDTDSFTVYIFYDCMECVLYVGDTECGIEKRLANHRHLPKECYERVCKIKYAKVQSKTAMKIYQTYYINLLHPIYNSAEVYDENNIGLHLPELEFKEFNPKKDKEDKEDKYVFNILNTTYASYKNKYDELYKKNKVLSNKNKELCWKIDLLEYKFSEQERKIRLLESSNNNLKNAIEDRRNIKPIVEKKKNGRPLKFTEVEILSALKMLEDYSYREVEDRTGISKSTLIRAGRKIKKICNLNSKEMEHEFAN